MASSFYAQNLNRLVPQVLLDSDTNGDFQDFLDILAVDLDAFTDLIDKLKEHFSPRTVDSDFSVYLAAYLGIDLDDGDTVLERRRILEKTVELYKRKGTQLAFTVYMSNLKFDAIFRGLWTEAYTTFQEVPGTLLEDGGTWYMSAHVNIELVSLDPVVTLDAATTNALLARITRFLPVQLVIDNIILKVILTADAVDPDDDGSGALDGLTGTLNFSTPASNMDVGDDTNDSLTIDWTNSISDTVDPDDDAGTLNIFIFAGGLLGTSIDEWADFQDAVDDAGLGDFTIALNYPFATSDIVDPVELFEPDLIDPITQLDFIDPPDPLSIILAMLDVDFIEPADDIVGQGLAATIQDIIPTVDVVRTETVYLRDQASARAMPHNRNPTAGNETLRHGASDELFYDIDSGAQVGQYRA